MFFASRQFLNFTHARAVALIKFAILSVHLCALRVTYVRGHEKSPPPNCGDGHHHVVYRELTRGVDPSGTTTRFPPAPISLSASM